MAAPEVSSRQEAEEYAQLLADAINCGDKAEAKRCSERLASFNQPVTVQLCKSAKAPDPIELRVGIEDAQSDGCIPVTVMVTVHMTISELKEKFNRDYGFHPSLQCWVIGKRLTQDTDTLQNHGLRVSGDQAFLFIRSAKAAHLTREQQKQDEKDRRIDGIMETIERCTLQPRGLGYQEVGRNEDFLPDLPPRAVQPPPVLSKAGWPCPKCTFVNKPTRPGCEICSADRPEDYKVPELYHPDEEEALRLQQEEFANLQYQQALEDERNRNFRDLLETDIQSLVGNTEIIECTICCSEIQPGEGAMLRECLHSFCRECLKGTVVNCTDAEVTCPFVDEAHSCACKLQDREIRSVLSQGEYQRFLELRLSIAESRSDNSFHCKTPDCAGWCIFEDDVNEFTCDVCKETNCLLCKAIHKDMNCKDYQDDLRIRAQNDITARQTTEMLQALLQNGEAMNCPKCKIVVQKKGGCDWICCSMCKTEICWVTKQARWGPKGQGDTSGGCRCRVNGIICHPNCQNCH